MMSLTKPALITIGAFNRLLDIDLVPYPVGN